MGVSWLFFMEFSLLFIIYLLFFSIISITILWYRERKDSLEHIVSIQENYLELIKEIAENQQVERSNLYDRLQAGTLQNYQENVSGTPNETEEETEDIVPIEDAQAEIES